MSFVDWGGALYYHLFQDKIHWIPAGVGNLNETWNVLISAIYYGDILLEGPHWTGMVDTGNNQLSLTGQAFDKLILLMGAKYSGSGNPEYECGTIDRLLPINVLLSGRNYTINKESYIDPVSKKGQKKATTKILIF